MVSWRRWRAVGTCLAVVLALILAGPSPVLAGRFAETARDELIALGRHAGYINATVIPCGGDEAEVGYFSDQVRKMLVAIGADEADLAIVVEAMVKARANAKPLGRDCTDQGGMELSSKLLQLRDAVRDAEK
ncbi:MAG: hypothetical protein O3B74_12560 [Proteobacteria bacterium]|nr:hypothetical protein [Pseudomonadota bacterium]MDA1309811.1 hypothetical protein [Pseudomonadota bacterium]